MPSLDAKKSHSALFDYLKKNAKKIEIFSLVILNLSQHYLSFFKLGF